MFLMRAISCLAQKEHQVVAKPFLMVAINMLHAFTVLHDTMSTVNPKWQTREMTFMLVTFIHKECLEIANVNNYLLIENENHLAGGMQHIILCHRLSICNSIDS
jgi:hypothetical protein